METVGIRELKANLSRYVARAKAGERIIVTDRGRHVAELAPLDPELQTLDRLAESGLVTWSGRIPVFERGPRITGSSASDAVIEQREDRVRALTGADT